MHINNKVNLFFKKLLNNGILVPLIFFIIIIFISSFHIIFQEYDGIMQYYASQEIFSGYGYDNWASQYWPPLFSLIIGFLSLFIPEFIAGKLISILAATLIIYLVFSISKELFDDKRIGLISQIFLILNPLFFNFAFIAENNMLETLFFILAIYLFFVTFKKMNYKRFFLIGIVIGLAGLTRYTSYILLPSFILILLIQRYNLSIEKNKIIVFSTIMIIAFILISAPWWYYNYLINGSPLYTLQYLNVGYGFFNLDDKLWWYTQNDYNNVASIFFTNPILYLKHFLINIKDFLSYLIEGMGTLIPFAIIAIPTSFFVIKSQYKWTLILTFSLFLLLVCQAFIYQEVLLSWVIILTIPSIFVFLNILKRIKNKKFKCAFSIVTILIAILMVSSSTYAYIIEEYGGGRFSDVTRTSNFLKQYDSNISNKYIMCVHPSRSYYINAKYLMIPLHYTGNLEGIVYYKGISEKVLNTSAKNPFYPNNKLKADYLIYDKSAEIYLPQFSFLLHPNKNSSKIPKNLKLIYLSDSVAIYKVY